MTKKVPKMAVFRGFWGFLGIYWIPETTFGPFAHFSFYKKYFFKII